MISKAARERPFLLMSRSKKIFLALAAVYLVVLIWVSLDIAGKTTFPNARPQLKERIKKRFIEKDSAKTDSLFRN